METIKIIKEDGTIEDTGKFYKEHSSLKMIPFADVSGYKIYDTDYGFIQFYGVTIEISKYGLCVYEHVYYDKEYDKPLVLKGIRYVGTLIPANCLSLLALLQDKYSYLESAAEQNKVEEDYLDMKLEKETIKEKVVLWGSTYRIHDTGKVPYTYEDLKNNEYLIAKLASSPTTEYIKYNYSTVIGIYNNGIDFYSYLLDKETGVYYIEPISGLYSKEISQLSSIIKEMKKEGDEFFKHYLDDNRESEV